MSVTDLKKADIHVLFAGITNYGWRNAPMPDMANMSPEQMKKMFEEMQRKENEGLSPEEIEKKNREKEEKKQRNLAELKETLEICEKGGYEKDGKAVRFEHAASDLALARVILPEEIAGMAAQKDAAVSAAGRTQDEVSCAFSCVNMDALSLAHEKVMDPSYRDDSGKSRILLLNLASAVKPGGGVRDGMNGQEEDLCRKSTLLMSLESDKARPYYDYNNGLNTRLGSDAVIISPNVEVFQDEKGELLDAPFTISVITCPAPNVRFGFEGKTEEEYRELLYERIEGIILCATALGYRNIILGAFGCGAFRNDAALVSDDFCQVLTGPAGRGLAHADFAVLCTPGKEYNYKEFCRNFSE